nr:O-antigen ligase family protein [uncultured Prevotella sp.]
MQISKDTIISKSYFLALIAFAMSACFVMREQEADGASEVSKYVIALVSIIWLAFPMLTLQKGYIFEKPSFVIIAFNIYLFWVVIISTIMPGHNDTTTSYINSIIWVILPILIFNTSYYYVLHKGTNGTLESCFVYITGLFVITYFSFFDLDNILLNIHLGSSYYALYILPIALIKPSITTRLLSIITVSLAIFSSVKRGGVMALALGLLAYIITQQIVSKRNKFSKVIIGIAILLIFACIFFYIGTLGDNNIFERFETIQEDQGSGRTEVWEEAWRLINDQGFGNYLIGNGFNTVVENSFLLLSAHNDYLEAWFDFGLIGVLLYSIAILGYLRITFLCVLRKRKYAPEMVLLASIIIVLSLISHIAIYYWFNVILLDIAILIGKSDKDDREQKINMLKI